MAKREKKHDPLEVPGLLEKAKGIPILRSKSFSVVVPMGTTTLNLICSSLCASTLVTRTLSRVILKPLAPSIYINKELIDQETEVKDEDSLSVGNEVFEIVKTVPDIVSRDELLYRFQCLIATLVNVCITGRLNFWSSYQKSFLKMFAGKDVPLQNIANMLKRELMYYEKEELFSTGQLAVLLAIERCETNLATAIVICFKDLISKMIKDPSRKLNMDLDECTEHKYELKEHENKLALEIFYLSLTESEQEVFNNIMDGVKTKIPPSLKRKFGEYIGH